MTDHTLRHYTEITRPALFSRVGVPAWKADGCPTFEDRVRARYDDLCRQPEQGKLDAQTAAALDAAFRQAVADVCAQ